MYWNKTLDSLPLNRKHVTIFCIWFILFLGIQTAATFSNIGFRLCCEVIIPQIFPNKIGEKRLSYQHLLKEI